MKHIPNILSFCRILLIPVFIWNLLHERTVIAASILAVSGVTDLLDGYLARKFHWVSQLGKVLDPIADKLTQLTVSMIFILRLKQYWYFFAILLFKDLFMLILGGYLVRKNVKLEGAKYFGKLATIFFYCTMVLILFVPSLPENVILTLLILTTCCAVYAAVRYFPEFIRYKKNISDGAKKNL